MMRAAARKQLLAVEAAALGAGPGSPEQESEHHLRVLDLKEMAGE